MKGIVMIATLTMQSEEARSRFRDILDTTVAGGEVVIERHGKPTAVVISYRRWEQMKAEHLELLQRWADEADANDSWVSQEEVDTHLLEQELA
jgi:prevent-host-death family protein